MKLQPFYFFLVVWGDQFLYYLTRLCLPALLAPNNIPALNVRRNNKFLFAMPKQDWDKFTKHPIFLELCAYVEPILLEISYPPTGVFPCQHMGVGHKLATDLCYQSGAYGVALTPDLILADGTIGKLESLAEQGHQIVLCAALRFSEEGVFAGLRQLSVAHLEQEICTEPLAISGAKLVKIGVAALHSQTLTYDFNSLLFAPNSPAAYWRVPTDGGILLHSLSWCPLLLDYSAITSHDTKVLDEWTIDGDYVCQNFSHAKKIYVCQDSDEMMMVSWAPNIYNPVSLQPTWLRIFFMFAKESINTMLVRATSWDPKYDSLKLQFFQLPVRWHIQPLNDEWHKMEQQTKKIIRIKSFAGMVTYYLGIIWRVFIRRMIIIVQAIFGDRAARQRIRDYIYFKFNLPKKIS